MFKKNKLEKQLLANIEKLNYILTRNNILEFAELLGNKKQLLFRNFLTRNSKGNWNWNWFYGFNCYFVNYSPKNSYLKYTCNRGLHF